jgi:hypothetical protein
VPEEFKDIPLRVGINHFWYYKDVPLKVSIAHDSFKDIPLKVSVHHDNFKDIPIKCGIRKHPDQIVYDADYFVNNPANPKHEGYTNHANILMLLG